MSERSQKFANLQAGVDVIIQFLVHWDRALGDADGPVIVISPVERQAVGMKSRPECVVTETIKGVDEDRVALVRGERWRTAKIISFRSGRGDLRPRSVDANHPALEKLRERSSMRSFRGMRADDQPHLDWR